MKTKTITLRFDVPANERELLRGLDSLDADPEVIAAARGVATANAALEQRRHELQDLDSKARQVAAAVQDGRATTADVDQALVAVRRASLLVGPAERAVAAADAEQRRARGAAKDRALALVQERLAVLKAADAALLEQMNALDDWMDKVTFRLEQLCFDPTIGGAPEPYDLRGVTGGIPDRCAALLRQTI